MAQYIQIHTESRSEPYWGVGEVGRWATSTSPSEIYDRRITLLVYADLYVDDRRTLSSTLTIEFRQSELERDEDGLRRRILEEKLWRTEVRYHDSGRMVNPFAPLPAAVHDEGKVIEWLGDNFAPYDIVKEEATQKQLKHEQQALPAAPR